MTADVVDVGNILDAHELCGIVIGDHPVRPRIKDEPCVEVAAR